jgi:hypothetical protein
MSIEPLTPGSVVALREVAWLPARAAETVETELELRREQAILDVLRRGRAELREQVVALRRCVELAVCGADLVDEMRDAGELAEQGHPLTAEPRRFTLAELGLNHRRVSEWRSLRDNGALGFLDDAIATERRAALERASLNWVRQRVERIAREAAAEAADSKPAYDFELRHGDLRDALEDLVGKVDAIITDPPYGTAYLDEYDALGELAAQLLAPAGLLVVMVGQANLPRYLERLERHLVYRWAGACPDAAEHRR